MREGKKVIYGDGPVISGGLTVSTDLGFVLEELKPQETDVAIFGPVRADNVLAHAKNEFANIEDLVNMTKELVYYFAF